MTICIISHTEHYLDQQNQIVGWGSTVREINHLLEIADRIIHLAPLHKGEAPSSSLAYTSHRIQFIQLKPSGGKGLQKLSILFTAFHNLIKIHQHTKEADFIQFRAPTGMGVYVLPYLRFFKNKKYWVKYAGNWTDENMPLGNRLQKLFLLNCISKHTKVTYNGNWVKKSNFLSFENPCLTQEEYQDGQKCITHKEDPYQEGWQICFVGSLTKHKGIHLILDALKAIENNNMNIHSIQIVGDGPLMNDMIEERNQINVPITFHGYLAKEEVNNVLRKSHVLLLPSKSEGFPKVIAEAMNYGCIPVVTDVSCIKDYIKNNQNGILINQPTIGELTEAIEKVCNWNLQQFQNAIVLNSEMAKKFTYSSYNKALKESVLHV